jgi:hypothetical protein
MDAVSAIVANVFAALVAVFISIFDRPEALFSATLRGAQPGTEQTVKPLPEQLSALAPDLACTDFSAMLNPDIRAECITLFYAAAMEMDFGNPEVRRSALVSFESFKHAAAQSCRAEWIARNSQPHLPLSAACILAEKRLASLANMD